MRYFNFVVWILDFKWFFNYLYHMILAVFLELSTMHLALFFLLIVANISGVIWNQKNLPSGKADLDLVIYSYFICVKRSICRCNISINKMDFADKAFFLGPITHVHVINVMHLILKCVLNLCIIMWFLVTYSKCLVIY